MKILFTGGGTGGHVLPLIAVARELRRIYTAASDKNVLEMIYMGPKDPFIGILLLQEGIKIHTVPSGKLRRYWNIKTFFQNILDIFFKIPAGIFIAFFKMFFLSPDLILSKGGYGALPTTIAGWLFRVPIFLHESDIAPGLANRIGGRLAVEIFTSFPNTVQFPKKKVIWVGNPVRRELLSGNREEGQTIFSLQGGKPIILVLGGSQGAKRINEVLLNIIGQMVKDFEVIHQTGEKNFQEIKNEGNVMIPKELQGYYHPIAFFKEPELRHAYATADFIISRSGSGSVFEIAAVGKPSIMIPLPESAQNHQLLNAYAYGKTGAAIVLEHTNLTPHFLLEKIRSILLLPEEYAKMSKAALAFAKPEAARILAAYIIEYLKR
ncbi:MAG: UDP-N-acetylglucosamine--N-acetylmuramyl-(pentapeptide) pyrophosphoryl-undecaprenol N-acetylglucosamine transferase [Candidatus Wildermuthbacteria bacterium]|nr:UDP-N-acetylglucosamine--N-acetylmuramyl-(pentapeptide) pyrophosphoryl-undecaprenol N-acetylglucosamine transferase [Candidatus Wildermuthbacteria bacterium]